MKSLHTTLLREKFTIFDSKHPEREDAATIALSNRMMLDLVSDETGDHEPYVIRGQNMHTVVRMAALILDEYETNGPIAARGFFNWDKAWKSVLTDHEYRYNPDRWFAIYHKGKRIFEALENEVHPFLDMIEKCDFSNRQSYDYAIPMAQKLLHQSGKPIEMKYDANVALNVSIEDDEARVGVILRGLRKTTTFNFLARPRYPNDPLDMALVLNTAALFLEGLQLAFKVGMNEQKLKLRIIERQTDEHQQAREEREKLEELHEDIKDLGTVLDIKYRPERPDVLVMAAKAEALARKILQPPDDGDFVT